MKPKFKDLLIENLRSVTTIDLTIKSVVFLEKIFWTSIGIVGTLFAIYFFSIQIQTWKENPTIVTKGHIELSKLNYPAVTVCSKSSIKYGLAERLGNYIDNKSQLPNQLLFIRDKFQLCVLTNEMKEYFKIWKKFDHALNCLSTFNSSQGCKVAYVFCIFAYF